MARRSPAERRKLLARLLFFRSHTGGRLIAAFGEWFNRIVWENASPILAAHSGANPEPDLDHVRQALAEVKPDIVLAFGTRAAWAMAHVRYAGVLICGPHPAARQTTVVNRLAAMRDELQTTIDSRRTAYRETHDDHGA